jgi:hypothetical protein
MTREACPMSSITYEIDAYTRYHGEPPTVMDMARWLGLTLDIAGARIGRCTERGHVIRVEPERERRGAKGGKRRVLVLTDEGHLSLLDAKPLEGIPREHGVDVPVGATGGGRTCPDHDVGRRRLDIAREVVRDMGTTRDEDRTMDTCPVIVEVHRRWDAEDLGGAPWTLSEVAIVIGASRERVRQIEVEAMGKMRTQLRKQAEGIVDQLRELDAHRDGHWSCEVAA